MRSYTLPFPKAFQLVTVINWQAILSTFIQDIYRTSGEWLTDIAGVCSKAKQILGLLYRQFYVDSPADTLKQLYVSLVHPHLEYASQLWDHIAGVCSKAKQILGLLYRQFYIDSPADTLKQLYVSLVRPHALRIRFTTVGSLYTEGHLQTGKLSRNLL